MNTTGRNGVAAAQPTWKQKAATILPLVAFFAFGAFIDTSPVRDGETINANAYQWLVGLRVIAMSGIVIAFAAAIFSQFPFRIDRWGWLVGVLGAVVWIGVCQLQLERSLIDLLGLSPDWLPSREGVNPWIVYPDGTQRTVFLLTRFTLLALCVPVAEELFLRGFVIRAIEAEDWTALSLSQVTRVGWVTATLYGVVTHPGEVFAAALWFSLVTWLMVRTGKFWNCVVAHAVTNFILGLYVCMTGTWELW